MSFPLVIGVCLQLAAAPQVTPLFIPTNAFTLAWMHTIEKVRWEEDYEVIYEPKRGKAVLHAVAARIKGSAAGMEPPDNAQFKDGWYHYAPAESYPTSLRLTRSEFSADYEWCNDLGCMPLSSKMPTDGGVTKLSACTAPLLITSFRSPMQYHSGPPLLGEHTEQLLSTLLGLDQDQIQALQGNS